MGIREALPVEGRCNAGTGQAEIDDRGVAKATLLRLLVLRPGQVTANARLWLREREERQIFRSPGLVTECAFEGMGGVLEAEARRPGTRILPPDLRCGGSIVTRCADRGFGEDLSLDARGYSGVARATFGEEDRVLLMGETLLGTKSNGAEDSHQNDGRSGQKYGASHRFPLPTRPGSFPMGMSRFRWSRA
jgi:hypothetical protein